MAVASTRLLVFLLVLSSSAFAEERKHPIQKFFDSLPVVGSKSAEESVERVDRDPQLMTPVDGVFYLVSELEEEIRAIARPSSNGDTRVANPEEVCRRVNQLEEIFDSSKLTLLNYQGPVLEHSKATAFLLFEAAKQDIQAHQKLSTYFHHREAVLRAKQEGTESDLLSQAPLLEHWELVASSVRRFGAEEGLLTNEQNAGDYLDRFGFDRRVEVFSIVADTPVKTHTLTSKGATHGDLFALLSPMEQKILGRMWDLSRACEPPRESERVINAANYAFFFDGANGLIDPEDRLAIEIPTELIKQHSEQQ